MTSSRRRHHRCLPGARPRARPRAGGPRLVPRPRRAARGRPDRGRAARCPGGPAPGDRRRRRGSGAPPRPGRRGRRAGRGHAARQQRQHAGHQPAAGAGRARHRDVPPTSSRSTWWRPLALTAALLPQLRAATAWSLNVIVGRVGRGVRDLGRLRLVQGRARPRDAGCWPPRSRRCGCTPSTRATCAPRCTRTRSRARTSPTGRSRRSPYRRCSGCWTARCPAAATAPSESAHDASRRPHDRRRHRSEVRAAARQRGDRAARGRAVWPATRSGWRCHRGADPPPAGAGAPDAGWSPATCSSSTPARRCRPRWRWSGTAAPGGCMSPRSWTTAPGWWSCGDPDGTGPGRARARRGAAAARRRTAAHRGAAPGRPDPAVAGDDPAHRRPGVVPAPPRSPIRYPLPARRVADRGPAERLRRRPGSAEMPSAGGRCRARCCRPDVCGRRGALPCCTPAWRARSRTSRRSRSGSRSRSRRPGWSTYPRGRRAAVVGGRHHGGPASRPPPARRRGVGATTAGRPPAPRRAAGAGGERAAHRACTSPRPAISTSSRRWPAVAGRRAYADITDSAAPHYLWHEFGDSTLLLPRPPERTGSENGLTVRLDGCCDRTRRRLDRGVRAIHDRLARLVAGRVRYQLTAPERRRGLGRRRRGLAPGQRLEIGRYPLAAAAGAARKPPGNQDVWDRWNAMAPADQSAGFVESQERWSRPMKALTRAAESIEIDLGFTPNRRRSPPRRACGSTDAGPARRDVEVGIDPLRRSADDSAALAGRAPQPTMTFLLGFVGKPEGTATGPRGPRRLHDRDRSRKVARSGQRRHHGDVPWSLEAAIRAGGRLKPQHTPGPGVDGTCTWTTCVRCSPGTRRPGRPDRGPGQSAADSGGQVDQPQPERA